MEWDRGAPWYRPDAREPIPAGARLSVGAAAGRSGLDYYLDSLPAAVDIGLGSPTGVEFLRPLRLPGEVPRSDVWLRLGDRQDSCDHRSTRRRQLHRQGRSLPRRPPAERHRLRVGPTVRSTSAPAVAAPTAASTAFAATCRSAPRCSDMGEGIERALRPTADRRRLGRGQGGRRAASPATSGMRTPTRSRSTPTASSANGLRAIDLLVYFGPRPSDQLLTQLSPATSSRRSAPRRRG